MDLTISACHCYFVVIIFFGYDLVVCSLYVFLFVVHIFA
jgi:hypothetical protein